MLTIVVASMSLAVLPVDCVEPDVVPVSHANHEALYKEGIPFREFLDAAERRRPLWLSNYGQAVVSDAVLTRARAVEGRWHLLAVAVDGCSDSVNTIPFLAKLAEQVDGLELRIVHPDDGRHIMEAHRTPDGRPSTPTVLLLDARFDEVGCFIERPKPLQDWWLANLEEYGREERYEKKMDWYANDMGATTVDEVVGLMEMAAAGQNPCG